MQYNSIMSSIPSRWKNKLRHKKLHHLEIWIDSSLHVILNSRAKNIKKVTTKEIYWEFLNNIIKPPTCIDKWVELYPFPDKLEWKNTFKLPYKIVRETYLQTFQYKIINRT